MRHVTHVASNIKSGVDTELGEKTYIVGNNGVGKTAIVDAVTLALGGIVFDFAGRDSITSDSMLIRLIPAEEESIWAKATLDNGTEASYKNNRTARGAGRPDTMRPVRAYFPIQEVRAALTGSVNTARTWLLDRIADHVDTDDLAKRFADPDIWNDYERLAKSTNTEGTIATLLAVKEAAAKRLRTARSEVSKIEVGLASLGSIQEPTPKALEQAENEVARLRQAMQGASEQQRRYDAAQAVLSAQQELDAHTSSEPAGMVSEQTDLFRVLGTGWDALVTGINLGLEACPSCGQDLTPEIIQDRKKTQDVIQARVQQLQVLQAWTQKRDMLQGMLDRAQHHYQSLGGSDPAQETPPDKHITQSYEYALDQLNTLRARANEFKRAASLREDIAREKKQARRMEPLVEACKEAEASLLKAAHGAFVGAVQAFLPDEDKFVLELTAGDKEVCYFGLWDDRTDTLRTTLSGAQWARLTLAMAAATIKHKGPNDINIIVPEERAYDPKTFTKILRALTEAPGQVIITSPVDNYGQTPKGWTKVVLEG